MNLKTILIFFLSLFAYSAMAGTGYAASDNNCPCLSHWIDHDITINVPGKYCLNNMNTIQDALAYLNNKIIEPKSTVTIKMVQNPTASYDTININHQNADRIHIIGDCGDQKVCTINFKPDADGLIIKDGHSLKELNNFTFVGQITKYQPIGILVDKNSSINFGDNITINNFFFGIFAKNNSNIFAQAVKVNHCTKGGIVSAYNSVINADYAKVNDSHNAIAAGNGGVIFSSNALAENSYYGFDAAAGGYIYASNSIAKNNSGHGFAADSHAFLTAINCQSLDNKACGYEAYYDSYILAKNIIAEGNKSSTCIDGTSKISYLPEAQTLNTVMDFWQQE